MEPGAGAAPAVAPAAAARERRERLVLHGVAAAVSMLALAPLLRGGYVLRLDMVFVPRQPLRWDLVAPESGLPRAVPQDVVVSLLSVVMPGWLIQRVALFSILYLAALGAARLVPATGLATRVVAAVGYAWTPYLAERLLLGQWGLLACYAALPWLVLALLRLRQAGPSTPQATAALAGVALAGAACALTPTGGVIAVATAVALLAARRPNRLRLAASGALLLLNGPWLVAALTSAAGGRSDPAGVAAFSVRAENWSGSVGAVLGTGGIWNALATPLSRATAVVPLVTLVLLALAAYGVGELRRRFGHEATLRLWCLAAGGMAVALLGVAPPGAGLLEWMVANVSGAGLLRDGHKFLIPYTLMLVLCAALGVARLAARLSRPRARLAFAAAAVLPLALLPDLAFGGLGTLRPVSYPADWDAVAGLVAASPGEVLALPFGEYHRYQWNNGQTVIDPAPRYLDAGVLVDDTLRVGELVVAGEDPRAAQVREVLAEGGSVAALGVRWVLVEKATGEPIPAGALSGLRVVYTGAWLDLYANPDAAAGPEPRLARRAGLLVVHLLAAAVPVAAIWRLRRRRAAW